MVFISHKVLSLFLVLLFYRTSAVVVNLLTPVEHVALFI